MSSADMEIVLSTWFIPLLGGDYWRIGIDFVVKIDIVSQLGQLH